MDQEEENTWNSSLQSLFLRNYIIAWKLHIENDQKSLNTFG